MTNTPPEQRQWEQPILGLRVQPTSPHEVTMQVIRWAKAGESRVVYTVNMQRTMQAHQHAYFREIINQADLVISEGQSLVWMLRLLGCSHHKPVDRQKLIKQVLCAAEKNGLSVGFYGSQPDVYEALIPKLQDDTPGLSIVYAASPADNALGEGRRERILTEIRLANPQILFVSLGSPREERWMAENRGELPMVMLGAGRALEAYAGRKDKATAWRNKPIKALGRLWRRMIKDYPQFIWHATLQLVGKGAVEDEAP